MDNTYDISKLSSLLPEGDVLIIVPPFTYLDRPSLAVHILQACARTAGFRVSVLYANILLASAIGVENYLLLAEPKGEAAMIGLLGERFFAPSAYDSESLGDWTDRSLGPSMRLERAETGAVDEETLGHSRISSNALYLKRLQERASPWADEVAAAVVQVAFQVVACTTTYEQTNASLALLKRIKRHQPHILAIIGGGNCEGEMAEGILSLDPHAECVDYIFSGESEEAFPAFLQDLFAHTLPSERIISGKPCQDLDALPTPHFDEYFQQRDYYLPHAAALAARTCLPYETSRGCWWGEKHKCTFCGLSDESKSFRQKSPTRVISELQVLTETHGVPRVSMTDQIMPYSYFGTLLPRLPDELPGVKIWYEMKANLSLAKVLALKKAGVVSIQPGIEALSSALLRRMNKGVLARQNVTLLRYARSVGMHMMWNLLWGFPGDEAESYEETLALLPLIHHLQPPDRAYHLWIDRFSEYFDHPAKYEVTNIRPLPAYNAAFPAWAPLDKVAYHFIADYECASRHSPDIIRQVAHQVDAWKKCWASGTRSTEVLLVARSDEGDVLIDKRGLPGTQPLQRLNRAQASIALVARPYVETEEVRWALEQKIGVALDSWYVPLAVARPELLQEYEDELRVQKLDARGQDDTDKD